MPADTNSLIEDGENSPTTAPTGLPEPTVTKHNRYKCPDDFVSFTHKPCSSTLSNSLKNKNSELWLIKAPASFNPERFNGVAVPLSGLQTVRMAAVAPGTQAASGAGGNRQCLYSVLGTKRSPADLHLLTADGPASGQVVCGPAFAGVLNVCEVYGDGGHALRNPQAIAAAPAPAIPPGLKQRFLPFGCKTPAVKHSLAEEEDEVTEAERRKERKRRKREKRIKTAGQDPGEDAVTAEAVEVKTEPDGAVYREEGGASEECSSSSRRKKKKKKDKEKEAWGEGGCVVKKEEEEEEAPGNSEPMDVSSENLEGSAKKKKKKRKSKVEEA